MDITILGIESSCDDTSAAVIRDRTLLSNVIASQAVHQKYGGVIPELASRAHQQNIVPVVDTALKEAGVTIDKIDAIAFTRGPGLLGSLLVGVSFAKGLSISHDIPLVEVNHLQGHILSHFHGPARPTASAPRLSVPLPAGQRRTYPNRKSGRSARHADRRHDDRRRGGRSVRQVRQSHGAALSGRAGDRQTGQGGRSARRSASPNPASRVTTTRSRDSKPRSSIRCGTKWPKIPNFIEKNKADLCASLQTTIVEILLDKLVKASKEYGHPRHRHRRRRIGQFRAPQRHRRRRDGNGDGAPSCPNSSSRPTTPR